MREPLGLPRGQVPQSQPQEAVGPQAPQSQPQEAVGPQAPQSQAVLPLVEAPPRLGRARARRFPAVCRGA